MLHINERRGGKMRTVVALVVGIGISMLGSAVLDHLMKPRDFAPALHKALMTEPRSAVAPEVMTVLQKAGRITVYIVDPTAGLVIGIFVGLVQKKHPITLALICWLPRCLLDLVSDSARQWATSLSGVVRYLFDSSLPFITAFVGVVLAQYLLTRLSRFSGETEI